MWGVHLNPLLVPPVLMILRGKGTGFDSKEMKLCIPKSRGLTLTVIKLVLAPNWKAHAFLLFVLAELLAELRGGGWLTVAEQEWKGDANNRKRVNWKRRAAVNELDSTWQKMIEQHCHVFIVSARTMTVGTYMWLKIPSNFATTVTVHRKWNFSLDPFAISINKQTSN